MNGSARVAVFRTPSSKEQMMEHELARSMAAAARVLYKKEKPVQRRKRDLVAEFMVWTLTPIGLLVVVYLMLYVPAVLACRLTVWLGTKAALLPFWT